MTKSNKRQMRLARDYSIQAKKALAEVILTSLSAGEKMALQRAFDSLEIVQAVTQNLEAELYDQRQRHKATRKKSYPDY